MLQTATQPERKMSSKEAALALTKSGFSVTSRTIIGMCKRGELEGARKIGKLWFIPPQSVQKLID